MEEHQEGSNTPILFISNLVTLPTVNMGIFQ
jgi:hypothetical protein